MWNRIEACPTRLLMKSGKRSKLKVWMAIWHYVIKFNCEQTKYTLKTWSVVKLRKILTSTTKLLEQNVPWELETPDILLHEKMKYTYRLTSYIRSFWWDFHFWFSHSCSSTSADLMWSTESDQYAYQLPYFQVPLQLFASITYNQM